jgi:replicative DNA helicase
MPVDRLPPQNVEAEQSVLGSLLIDREAVIRVASFLRPDDFYRETHGEIYGAILSLYERREPADFITLCDELERRNQLETVGGASYLTSLINIVPTAAHVEHYGHIVERAAMRRRLIQASARIAEIAYDEALSVDDVIDLSEQHIFAVAQRRLSRDLVPLSKLLYDYFDQIEDLQQHPGETMGVSTGFIDLDKLLGGFQPSDLIIVAGRPGMGKTSLITTMAQNVAEKRKGAIAVFSLEMPGNSSSSVLWPAKQGLTRSDYG